MSPAPGLGDELTRLLHSWMPAQRWYPAKGRGVGLRDLGAHVWPSSEPGVQVVTHVIGLDSGDRLDVVQVPLTYRSEALPSVPATAVVGVLGDDGESRHVSDGTHDPAFVRALLGALRSDSGGTPVPPRPGPAC